MIIRGNLNIIREIFSKDNDASVKTIEDVVTGNRLIRVKSSLIMKATVIFCVLNLKAVRTYCV